jgi:hypothetical protein
MYTITPTESNCMVMEEIFTKGLSEHRRSDRLKVSVKVDTVFRWGIFTIYLTDEEKEEILSKEEVRVSDYECELSEMRAGYLDFDDVVVGGKATKGQREEIEEAMSCGGDYDLELENIGFKQDETNYVMTCEVELTKEEEDDEEVNSESDEETAWCFRCDEYFCMDHSGGDWGENEEWVCNRCLPTCLKCGGQLWTSEQECCGRGRSDDSPRCAQIIQALARGVLTRRKLQAAVKTEKAVVLDLNGEPLGCCSKCHIQLLEDTRSLYSLYSRSGVEGVETASVHSLHALHALYSLHSYDYCDGCDRQMCHPCGDFVEDEETCEVRCGECTSKCLEDEREAEDYENYMAREEMRVN